MKFPFKERLCHVARLHALPYHEGDRQRGQQGGSRASIRHSRLGQPIISHYPRATICELFLTSLKYDDSSPH